MDAVATVVRRVTIASFVHLTKDGDKKVKKLRRLRRKKFIEKYRAFIQREIDDNKSRLDELARENLLNSIVYFVEGVNLWFELFYNEESRKDYSDVTLKSGATGGAEKLSHAERMRNLEQIALSEEDIGRLARAKEWFKLASDKAKEAFANEALKQSDRVLAMQYQVMATLLETAEKPTEAIAACRACLQDLHRLSSVQECFRIELKGSFRERFRFKDERRKILAIVCRLNHLLYEVTKHVEYTRPVRVWNWLWSFVDIGDEKVNPLFDGRVIEVLRAIGLSRCGYKPWSFSGKGSDWPELAKGITRNTKGHFVIVDWTAKVVMYDSNGEFMQRLHFPAPDGAQYRLTNNRTIFIFDVATDKADNIYVLVKVWIYGAKKFQHVVYLFDSSSSVHGICVLRDGMWYSGKPFGLKPFLAVTDNGKMLVLWTAGHGKDVIDLYETGGRFVRSFGRGILNKPSGIAAGNERRVLVVDYSCVHVFSEEGNHLFAFKLRKAELLGRYKIAFHKESELIFIIGSKSCKITMLIYTKDGEYVSSIELPDGRCEGGYASAITATSVGGIAIGFVVKGHKSIEIVVY